MIREAKADIYLRFGHFSVPLVGAKAHSCHPEALIYFVFKRVVFAQVESLKKH